MSKTVEEIIAEANAPMPDRSPATLRDIAGEEAARDEMDREIARIKKAARIRAKRRLRPLGFPA